MSQCYNPFPKHNPAVADSTGTGMPEANEGNRLNQAVPTEAANMKEDGATSTASLDNKEVPMENTAVTTTTIEPMPIHKEVEPMSTNTKEVEPMSSKNDTTFADLCQAKTYKVRMYIPAAKDKKDSLITFSHGTCELFELITRNGGSIMNDTIVIDVKRERGENITFKQFAADALEANKKLIKASAKRGYVVFAVTAASAKEGKIYLLRDKYYKIAMKHAMANGRLPKEYSVNKFLIQNGLMLSTSVTMKSAFGRSYNIDNCVFVDDLEITTIVDYIMVNYNGLINDVQDGELRQKITDGIVIAIIDDDQEPQVFTVRAGAMIKGLVVEIRRGDLINLLKHLGLPESIMDIWGNRFEAETLEAIIPKSVFKRNKFFDSREQVISGWKENHIEFRACLINEEHKLRDLPYQQAQTLELEEYEKIELYEKIEGEINKLADPKYATILLGKKLAEVLCKYPKLLNIPAVKAAINAAYSKKKLSATAGRILHAVRYEFLLPDIVAVISGYFGGKITAILKEDECHYGKGRNIVCFSRCPHLLNDHVVMRNYKALLNDDLYSAIFCHKNVVYISVYSTAFTRLMFDYDGDKVAVIWDMMLQKIIEHQSQDKLYIWNAPEANVEKITADTVIDYVCGLYNPVNIGQFCFGLNKLYANDLIDNDLYKGYLKMMANIAIDATKNKNVRVIEPEGLRDLLKQYTQPLYVLDAKLLKDKNYKVDPDKFGFCPDSWLDVHCDKLRRNTPDTVFENIEEDVADFDGFIKKGWGLVPDFVNMKKQDKEAGYCIRLATMSRGELLDELGVFDIDPEGDVYETYKDEIRKKIAEFISTKYNSYTGLPKTWDDGFCSITAMIFGTLGLGDASKFTINWADPGKVWMIKPVLEFYFTVYAEEFEEHYATMEAEKNEPTVEYGIELEDMLAALGVETIEEIVDDDSDSEEFDS